VAVGWGTIATSPDGVQWTVRSAGTAYNLSGIGYGDGVWLAVGSEDLTFSLVSPESGWSVHNAGGVILSSTNGITWEARPSGTSHVLTGIGYGDGDEATVVSYGLDPANKFIMTYFRHAFTNLAVFNDLRVVLRRDDGAVAYLNDAEIFRSNLAAGTINYLTLATSATDDGNTLFTNTVSPSLMRRGRNVLAVEIHQSSGGSSDISFDLALIGSTGAIVNNPPTVSLISPAIDHRSVVLPQPDGPMMQRNSPSRTSSETLSSAWSGPDLVW
jgi:hypothetical protein